MTRLPRDVILAPVGLDLTSDPTALDAVHCQNLVNFLQDRSGKLRGNISMPPITLNGITAQIDGCWLFYGEDQYTTGSGFVAATKPNLLVASGGTFYSFQMNASSNGEATSYPPTFNPAALATVTGFNIAGHRTRFVGFEHEVFAFQDQNADNTVRIESGGSVYQQGIVTPNAVALSGGVLNTVPTTPAQTITSVTNSGGFAVVNVANHGFNVGQAVYIQGVTGTPLLNGSHYVGSITTNSFQVYASNSGVIEITGASTGEATTTLFALNQFNSYSWSQGDTFTVVSGVMSGSTSIDGTVVPGGSIPTGVYAIVAKQDGSNIILYSSPVPPGGGGGSSIGGYISSAGGVTGAITYVAGGVSSATVVPFLKNGVVQYAQTWVDTFGRESDLSTPFVVNFGTTPLADAIIVMTGLSTAPAGVLGANLYATQGGSQGLELGVFYRLNSTLIEWTSGPDPTFEDNQSSLEVSAGTISANYGENEPPYPASLGCLHHNRLMENLVGQAAVLQISNSGSPTQFAAVPQNALDGETLTISVDQGNIITGLASFGSMFAIWLRRGLYVLEGDDYTTWDLRQIHDRGCIAPDSVVRADNHICFLSDDGTYVVSYIYRVTLEKFSKPIEKALQAYNATVAGRQMMEAAQGTFCNNRYVLSIGNTIYAYDFDATGWTILQLSGSATITSMTTVQTPGTPGMILIGRSDSTCCWLDEYTTPQTVAGLVYVTRLVQADPDDETSRGKNVVSLHKRIKRVIVYGSGTITSGTITVTCDGRSESYPIPLSPSPTYPYPRYAVLGAIIYQEFSPACHGEQCYVTLLLNGTGIVLQPVEVSYQPIG